MTGVFVLGNHCSGFSWEREPGPNIIGHKSKLLKQHPSVLHADPNGKRLASSKLGIREIDGSEDDALEKLHVRAVEKAFRTKEDTYQLDQIKLRSMERSAASLPASNPPTLTSATTAPSSACSDVTIVADAQGYQDEEDLSEGLAGMHLASADEILTGNGAQFQLETFIGLSPEDLNREISEATGHPRSRLNPSFWHMVWGRVSRAELDDIVQSCIITVAGGGNTNSHRQPIPAAGHGCTQGSNDLKSPTNKRKRGGRTKGRSDSISTSSSRSRRSRKRRCLDGVAASLKRRFRCPISAPGVPILRCREVKKFKLRYLQDHLKDSHSDLVPEAKRNTIKHTGHWIPAVQVYFRIKYVLFAAIRERHASAPWEAQNGSTWSGGWRYHGMDDEYCAFIAYLEPRLHGNTSDIERLVQETFTAWESRLQELIDEEEIWNLLNPSCLDEPTGPNANLTHLTNPMPTASRLKSTSSHLDSGYGTASTNEPAAALQSEGGETAFTVDQYLHPDVGDEASTGPNGHETVCTTDLDPQPINGSQLALPPPNSQLPPQEYVNPSFLSHRR